MARKIHLRLSFSPDNKKWHIPEENKSTGGMFLNIPSVENGKLSYANMLCNCFIMSRTFLIAWCVFFMMS